MVEPFTARPARPQRRQHAVFACSPPAQILPRQSTSTLDKLHAKGGAMSRTRKATLTRVSGLIVATGLYMSYLAAPAAAEQRISWTAMRNVAVNGDVVQKTGGCQGCEDAGAISQQMLSGDGYVQFAPGETNTFWYAGLTRRNDLAQHADMDFAFRFNGAGQADVVENGNYSGGATPHEAGDLFRIAIVGGPGQS